MATKLSYKEATGVIEFTLKDDGVFHYSLQHSPRALAGLVSALEGIKPEDIKSIVVENPIDLSSLGKETVMDLKLTLNSGKIMNIELQTYMDSFWRPRAILYLCRAYDSLKEGEDYSKLKQTMHYCITDQNLFPENPEFYARYRLLNIKNHRSYSDMLGINVLQLNHAELATQEDIDNGLLYWTKLFMAKTWEEMQALMLEHEEIEEVADLILELNTDNQAKEILEGQRRYREQLATEYAAGVLETQEKYEAIIEKKDMEFNAIIEDKDAEIADKDAEIADKNAEIADKDAMIAKLLAENEELKKKK